jgi:hypothetical protein
VRRSNPDEQPEAGLQRTVTPGRLTLTERSGLNKIAFQGRISRSKKLPFGAYAMQITALNSAASA